MDRPSYLTKGEQSRLFPVLATTSKEGRTTSIFLACLARIQEFRQTLLESVGERTGKTSKLTTFTEVAFKGDTSAKEDRPDGLLINRTGSREWRALIETKVATNELDAGQIDRYRALAKLHKIDCVITISNQFATLPTNHPTPEVSKSKSKVPVYHWSWMFILTTVDLLLSTDGIKDGDQRVLLNELKRFLTHESAGVRGFERMPVEWTELNQLVGAGASVSVRSEMASAVVLAWHQECKDLALILSRQTETLVSQRLPRKHLTNPTVRLKDDLQDLKDYNHLSLTLDLSDAAAPLQVIADIPRRTIQVGMTLRAPEDKVSSKARVNWLLRQIKSDRLDDMFVRFKWPGRSPETQHAMAELKTDPSICEKDKQGLAVHSFHIFVAKRIGARFTQRSNFIADIEEIVPYFYGEFGQNLVAWQKKAPKISTDRQSAKAVNIEALSDDAESDAGH